MPPGCAFPGCKRSRSKDCPDSTQISFHRFPKDCDMKKAWMRACNLSEDFCMHGNVRICSRHFDVNDYERDLMAELLNVKGKRKLKWIAIPKPRKSCDPSHTLCKTSGCGPISEDRDLTGGLNATSTEKTPKYTGKPVVIDRKKRRESINLFQKGLRKRSLTKSIEEVALPMDDFWKENSKLKNRRTEIMLDPFEVIEEEEPRIKEEIIETEELNVSMIFGIFGACRRQELHKLQFADVKDLGSHIIVTLQNTKRKKPKTFTITGKYLTMVQNYIKLRPTNVQTKFFFLNYQKGRCTSQNVGINKMGDMGKVVAGWLNLPNPELYTGHCFRRSSATLYADVDGDILSLKRHGGWKSTTVTESCVDESIRNELQEMENEDILPNEGSIEGKVHFESVFCAPEIKEEYQYEDEDFKYETETCREYNTFETDISDPTVSLGHELSPVPVAGGGFLMLLPPTSCRPATATTTTVSTASSALVTSVSSASPLMISTSTQDVPVSSCSGTSDCLPSPDPIATDSPRLENLLLAPIRNIDTDTSTSKRFLLLAPKPVQNKTKTNQATIQAKTPKLQSNAAKVTKLPLRIFHPLERKINDVPPCATDDSEMFSISLARFPQNIRIPIKRKLLDVVDCIKQKNINPDKLLIAFFEV